MIGRVLKDNEKLESYRIETGSTICLFVKSLHDDDENIPYMMNKNEAPIMGVVTLEDILDAKMTMNKMLTSQAVKPIAPTKKPKPKSKAKEVKKNKNPINERVDSCKTE